MIARTFGAFAGSQGASVGAGKGFTLIEMMIVIAIMGILLALAAPSFTIYFEKTRTKRAAETMAAFLVNAKSESIKRNAAVRVVFQTAGGGTSWCAGMTTGANCDCLASPNTCTLDGVDRTISSTDYSGVMLNATGGVDDGDMFTFTHKRGTVNADTVRLLSDSGYEMRVVVSGIGRIRLCSPSGSGYIGGYTEC